MILTAHQPVYLPWLGLFHKIALADAFVSFNGVQYLPRDWNSRNKIKTANGPTWLTVPVLRHGYREKTIREIEINNQEQWRRKHWNSLCLAYGKAPYFQQYAPFFEEVYKKDWQYLTELDEYLLGWFLETLGIRTAVLNAADFTFQGVKSDLVLDMCHQLKASVYIFGALGREYADVNAFEAAGVQPIFQEYQHPVYPQLHGNFQSHLSIVDLLFNCGDRSMEVLMSGNMSAKEIPVWGVQR